MNKPNESGDMITIAEQFLNTEDAEQEHMHSNTQKSSKDKKKNKDHHCSSWPKSKKRKGKEVMVSNKNS
ncbi:hypothetical protein GUJ93_ZPchr0010g9783 [Zizania palustris]|uniref:Uncharacterized protein n=1 Tax=Zizania palustris TaxID=103762 RepID=A0A8J5T9M0_ZIZPA|nr:hypothetical protein GUJ93_ZPchr0010g9783 [Zizania palustris]